MEYGFLKTLSSVLSNQTQELILLPTEKCNFRCTYCYEDFKIGRMSKDTITGIKAFLEHRSSELNYLHISWFGGEPLLAKDIVFDVSSYASQLANIHTGLTYKSSMTTNGYYLTLSTLAELCKVGVRSYQISLDGPQKLHDCSRLKANGKGTFATIWKNLLDARNSDEEFSIILRLHFNPDTIEHLDPLINELRSEFIHDSRFKFFFKAIERLGGPNDKNIKILSPEDKESTLQNLNQKLYGFTKQNSCEEPYICYAARPNSLLIRADGRISKCTVALNDNRNDIGSLNSDGTLEINNKRLTSWIRGISTLDPDSLSCPLRNLPSE